MGSVRDWLLNIVAPNLALQGLNGLDLNKLAQEGGIKPSQRRKLFPNHQALMLALVDEISQEHLAFIQAKSQTETDARKRLEQFIVASLDYLGPNQALAQVIAVGLLSNDQVVTERVHEVYRRVFSVMLDDMLAEGIIPDKDPLLVTDLTRTLLSVVFLGGCPWLRMEYLSFVYHDKVAISVLNALQERYMKRMYENMYT